MFALLNLPQGKVEGRLLIGCRFGPDFSTVTMDDSLHRRKTDARPGKVALTVQTLKSAEQHLRPAHVEAGAIVAHEKDILSILAGRAEFNTG